MQPRVRCQVPPELKTSHKRVAMRRNQVLRQQQRGFGILVFRKADRIKNTTTVYTLNDPDGGATIENNVFCVSIHYRNFDKKVFKVRPKDAWNKVANGAGILIHILLMEFLTALASWRAVKYIEGATIENNVFCVSVHYRNVDKKLQNIGFGIHVSLKADRIKNTTTVYTLNDPDEDANGACILIHILLMRSLVEAVKSTKGATIENNVFCISIHYRNVDKKVKGVVEKTTHEVLQNYLGLILREGDMVFELCPEVAWNKLIFLLMHCDLKPIRVRVPNHHVEAVVEILTTLLIFVRPGQNQ
uniref:Uncharacterized protein n=1 Tax=Oryza brachyantha TaxID=4533 RepID=J3L135_ORYBR